MSVLCLSVFMLKQFLYSLHFIKFQILQQQKQQQSLQLLYADNLFRAESIQQITSQEMKQCKKIENQYRFIIGYTNSHVYIQDGQYICKLVTPPGSQPPIAVIIKEIPQQLSQQSSHALNGIQNRISSLTNSQSLIGSLTHSDTHPNTDAYPNDGTGAYHTGTITDAGDNTTPIHTTINAIIVTQNSLIFYQNIQFLAIKLNEIKSDYEIQVDLQQNEKIQSFCQNFNQTRFFLCSSTLRSHIFQFDEKLQFLSYKIVDLSQNCKENGIQQRFQGQKQDFDAGVGQMTRQERFGGFISGKSGSRGGISGKGSRGDKYNSSNDSRKDMGYDNINEGLRPQTGVIKPIISCSCQGNYLYCITKNQLYVVNINKGQCQKQYEIEKLIAFGTCVQTMNDIQKFSDQINRSDHIKILMKQIVAMKKNTVGISTMIEFDDKQSFIPCIIFINLSSLGVNIMSLQDQEIKQNSDKLGQQYQDIINDVNYQCKIFKEIGKFTSQEAIDITFKVLLTPGDTLDIQLGNDIYQIQLQENTEIVPQKSTLFGVKLQDLLSYLQNVKEQKEYSQFGLIEQLPLFIRNYIVLASQYQYNKELLKQIYDQVTYDQSLFERLFKKIQPISISQGTIMQIKFRRESQQQSVTKSLRQSMRQSMLLSTVSLSKQNNILDLCPIQQYQIRMNRKFNRNTLFLVANIDNKIVQAFINQIGQLQQIEYTTNPRQGADLIDNFTFYMRNEQLKPFIQTFKEDSENQAKQLIELIQQKCLINAKQDANWLQQKQSQVNINDLIQANEQKIEELTYCIQYLKELKLYNYEISKLCTETFQVLKFIKQILMRIQYNEELLNVFINVFDTYENKQYAQAYQLTNLESIFSDCKQFIQLKIDMVLNQLNNNQYLQNQVIECLDYVVQEEIMNKNMLQPIIQIQQTENQTEEQLQEQEFNQQQLQQHYCGFVTVENIQNNININQLQSKTLIQVVNFIIYYLNQNYQNTDYIKNLFDYFTQQQYEQEFALLLMRYNFWDYFRQYVEKTLEIENYHVQSYCNAIANDRQLSNENNANNILFRLALYYEDLVEPENENVSSLDIENRKLSYLRDRNEKPEFLLPELFLDTIRKYCIEIIESGKTQNDIQQEGIEVVKILSQNKLLQNYH